MFYKLIILLLVLKLQVMLLARGIHHSTIYFAQYCRDVISILFSPISCGLVVLMKTFGKIIIIRRRKIVFIYSINVA